MNHPRHQSNLLLLLLAVTCVKSFHEFDKVTISGKHNIIMIYHVSVLLVIIFMDC